jgi:hypothetical protein
VRDRRPQGVRPVMGGRKRLSLAEIHASRLDCETPFSLDGLISTYRKT